MSYLVVFLILTGFVVAYLVLTRQTTPEPVFVAPEKWKQFLEEHIDFYRKLPESEKRRFEGDLHHFLKEVRITGVETEVTLDDRLLIASSAIIPLFGFPVRTYSHLNEVLLYPGSFDHQYNIGSKDAFITGMVGSGPMEGKMILSKPALHMGFDIISDRKNVGIHEFVHLFDKETGSIDGIPPGFEDKKYTLPWIDMIQKMTRDIVANRSDIDGYATTNRQEFFAVASEYFFEQPDLLKRKHPKLYETLAEVFHQDLSLKLSDVPNDHKKQIGRNEPCPCGSGKKYKKCCLD